ncbi:MAG: DUF4395 family protein [Armatimonadetes bacterium]|nr:DUF4395 family protein [Armatimonadota bacterium]
MNDMARIPRDAFRFCRYSLAVLMWVGVLTHQLAPIFVVWLIMASSVALTIRRSPLIVLWTRTVHRLRPSPYEELSVGAMRFSHALATVLIGLPLLALSLAPGARGAWALLWVMTVMKTVSAVYACPASKMYTCLLSGGQCCSFLKRPHAGE